MKLIVGLGNPGSRYSETRHNAGRSLLEWIAANSKSNFKPHKKLKASVSSVSLDSEETLLAYPEIFMNVSGEAVSLLANYYKIEISKDLLIAVDDIALPFGKFRLRGKGSDGGHNGLKSVAAFLKTTNYPRLRFGIAPEQQIDAPLEEFVLDRFTKSEKKALESVYEKGFQACLAWATQSISNAMNDVNA